MQLALAITLSVLYVGLALTFGDVRQPGPALWFFVPAGITMLASFAAERISTRLPVPWSHGRGFGAAPRRVHLSWRAAVRLPAGLPWLTFPWNMLSVLGEHFALGWVSWLAAALLLSILVVVVRKRRRERQLLRDGEVASARVVRRIINSEGYDEVAYHFVTADGSAVSGRASDTGYGVREGSLVPVFYEKRDPGRHVVACASWFEAD